MNVARDILDERHSREERNQALAIRPIESSIPFAIFLTFVAFFYLRIAARVPAIAPLRPELLLAALVVIALIPHLSQRIALLQKPTAKALNILVIWIVISLPFVEWPGSVIRENWFPFVKVILLFYFTIFLVDTPQRLRIFVWCFLAFQIIRVLEPLYLNLTSGYFGSATHLGGGEFAGRLSGAPVDVINPNGLGFVIATAVVFSHFLLWQSKSQILKLVYLAVLPAMLYALVLSMSRGGFIALLVGGFLIFRQSRRKLLLLSAAIGIAVFGWSVMSDVQKERYTSLIDSDTRQSGTVEGRFRGMGDEFSLGLNKPIFGHGLGTTPEAKVNVLGARRQAAHNLYAELMIEIGVVGLVLFLRFLWMVRGVVLENYRRRLTDQNPADGGSDFMSRLNRALSVIFWVYAVYSINYFGLSQDYWYIFCGICVAFGLISSRFSSNENESLSGDRRPVVAPR